MYPLKLGFLERFCTALSTSELDFETKKLLLVPRSFKRPKYDNWEDISEVVSNKVQGASLPGIGYKTFGSDK